MEFAGNRPHRADDSYRNGGSFVDTREKVEAFLPVVERAVGEGLATVERVAVRFYRGQRPGT